MKIFINVIECCKNIYEHVVMPLLRMFPFFTQPWQRMVGSPGLIVTGVCRNKWIVKTSTAVAIATIRLKTEQPEILEINIPKHITTPTELMQLCKVIQEKFKGTLLLILWHSFLQNIDCSDIIWTLAKSR